MRRLLSKAEQVELLERYLPFVLMDAVQRRGEHQFRTEPVQPEGDLLA